MSKIVKINEATIKKMVCETLRRVLKENNEIGHPAVYVGTYGKYNNGSLRGRWVDLTKFANSKEFYAYCNKLHKDEPSGQRELMFQDYEHIPKIFIGESWISERFWDFMKDNSYPYDVKFAVADHVSDVDEYFKQIENISVYPGCNNMTDVAWDIVKEFGLPQYADNYFDYEKYGREMSWDGPYDENYEGSIYDEFGVKEDDDEALGYAIIDQMYGDLKNVGKETIMNYFDFEAFGHALDTECNFIPYDNGYIELY